MLLKNLYLVIIIAYLYIWKAAVYTCRRCLSTPNVLCTYGFNLVVTSVNDNNYKRNKLHVQSIWSKN